MKGLRDMLRMSVNGLCVALIQFYRYGISPLLGPRCRFYPSCSQYALDALRLHGPAAGTFLAIKRVLRCHPWNVGGYDPAPARDDPHALCHSHCKSTLHG